MLKFDRRRNGAGGRGRVLAFFFCCCCCKDRNIVFKLFCWFSSFPNFVNDSVEMGTEKNIHLISFPVLL